MPIQQEREHDLYQPLYTHPKLSSDHTNFSHMLILEPTTMSVEWNYDDFLCLSHWFHLESRCLSGAAWKIKRKPLPVEEEEVDIDW